MTTQTELEKRLLHMEDVRKSDAYQKAFENSESYQYRLIALSAIKLAAAQRDLIEWLESGATSGDADIRRRIEEASK